MAAEKTHPAGVDSGFFDLDNPKYDTMDLRTLRGNVRLQKQSHDVATLSLVGITGELSNSTCLRAFDGHCEYIDHEDCFQLAVGRSYNLLVDGRRVVRIAAEGRGWDVSWIGPIL